MHDAQCTMQHAWCIMHDAWCRMHDAWCTMHLPSCKLHPKSAPCILHPAFCILHLRPASSIHHSASCAVADFREFVAESTCVKANWHESTKPRRKRALSDTSSKSISCRRLSVEARWNCFFSRYHHTQCRILTNIDRYWRSIGKYWKKTPANKKHVFFSKGHV